MDQRGREGLLKRGCLAILMAGLVGCSGLRSSRIEPTRWDATTSRVFVAPRDTIYAATMAYILSRGTVAEADPVHGTIKARLGYHRAAIDSQFPRAARVPEFYFRLTPIGPDSTTVWLRITRRRHHAESSAPELVDWKTPYEATLDSVAFYLKRERLSHPAKPASQKKPAK